MDSSQWRENWVLWYVFPIMQQKGIWSYGIWLLLVVEWNDLRSAVSVIALPARRLCQWLAIQPIISILLRISYTVSVLGAANSVCRHHIHRHECGQHPSRSVLQEHYQTQEVGHTVDGGRFEVLLCLCSMICISCVTVHMSTSIAYLKFHAPSRSGGRQITKRAQRERWWFGDRAVRAWVWKFFSHSFRANSKPYFGRRPLVVVINGHVFHCLQLSTRDRFALCSRSKKKRPLLATRHMHAGPPYKRRKQELTTRSGKAELRHDKPRNLFAFRHHTCMHFRLFAAIEKGLLQRFWKERQGHSQRLWALGAFYRSSHLKLVWILSSFDLFIVRACAMDNKQKRKGESKDRFRPTNQYRIRSKNQKLSSSLPIFSLSLSFSSLFLFLVAEERADHSWFAKAKHKHPHRHKHTDTHKKEKTVMISVCISWCWVVIENLVFLKGKFNTCWKVWVLMLAAGSDVLMKNDHRWAPINPAESHQRCWAEIHDPPGMPNFYGWRHGVGRRMQISKCELVHVVRGYSPKHFLTLHVRIRVNAQTHARMNLYMQKRNLKFKRGSILTVKFA